MSTPPKKRKLDNILETLRLQVEFYFSDINLRHDCMMSELTGAKNKSSFLRGTKWVLAEKLITFNRMKELATNGIDDIFDALESGPSALLEVDREEKRIRRFKPVHLHELEKDLTPCTIYVEGFSLDTGHDLLKEKFSQHGQVNYVSLPHFPENHPINGDQTRPLSQGYAFIEFSTPDHAIAAYHHYNKLSNFTSANQGTFFPRVMMKSTWLEYLNRYNKIQKIGYRECRRTILAIQSNHDFKITKKKQNHAQLI